MQPVSTPAAAAVLKCPVCGAKFRGVVECPRCRTDLSALARIAVRAWAARRHSREALLSGDLAAALQWAATARRLHQTGPRSG